MDQNHQQGEWTFETKRSHILNSKCTTPVICNRTRAQLPPEAISAPRPCVTKTADEFFKLRELVYGHQGLCQFCQYDIILTMAHLPDMTYAFNRMRLEHRGSGLALEFNALDALAPVLVHPIGLPANLKVSESEAWLRSRTDCQYTQNVLNAQFDWTFSTDYGGTFGEPRRPWREDRPPLSELIEPTGGQRIELNKLRIRKQINFFDEVELFEDELADHGVAQYSVKLRVHDDSFFLLARFFLRIDRVLVRYFDTRLYHEFGQRYLLRERSHRESLISELTAPEAAALLTQPQELFQFVPERQLRVDRIRLPDQQSSSLI